MPAFTQQAPLPQNPETRRRLLKAFLFGPAAAAGVGSLVAGCGGTDGGLAGGNGTSPVGPNGKLGATSSPGRFAKIGPISESPDANGVRAPEGFTSRVLAMAGFPPVAGASPWHVFPDGAGVMPLDDGGWLYISNSEIPGIGSIDYQVPQLGPLTQPLENLVPGLGGASALRFNSAGDLVASYPILNGTTFNCAGVVTPWKTWLSCEEHPGGLVWEVDPLKPLPVAVDLFAGVTGVLTGLTGGAVPQQSLGSGLARRTLGVFAHEAVAIDSAGKTFYMTEDEPDGRFYRWIASPTDWPAGAARPALQEGTLQVLAADEPLEDALNRPIRIRWVNAQNPDQSQRDNRLAETAVFRGGEGVWFRNGLVYFTTKGDDRVWVVDTRNNLLQVLYDQATAPEGQNFIDGVDNITMTDEGDLLVAEDGGNMQVNVIAPDGTVRTLLQVVGQDVSEIAGIAFSPDRKRLYFTSDRGGPMPQGGFGPGLGLVYELTIPDNI